MRRLKPVKKVCVNVHPNLYEKMEELRKFYLNNSGINLSQVQVSNILAQRIRPIKKINILGVNNDKKKNKSRSY